jgi:hypothetical protein
MVASFTKIQKNRGGDAPERHSDMVLVYLFAISLALQSIICRNVNQDLPVTECNKSRCLVCFLRDMALIKLPVPFPS